MLSVHQGGRSSPAPKSEVPATTFLLSLSPRAEAAKPCSTYHLLPPPPLPPHPLLPPPPPAANVAPVTCSRFCLPSVRLPTALSAGPEALRLQRTSGESSLAAAASTPSLVVFPAASQRATTPGRTARPRLVTAGCSVHLPERPWPCLRRKRPFRRSRLLGRRLQQRAALVCPARLVATSPPLGRRSSDVSQPHRV